MELSQDVRAPTPREGEAERLNHKCFCITFDRAVLIETLNRQVGSPNFAQELALSHPLLFSNAQTFVTADILAEMARVVDAVEAAALLPGYREVALSWAPPVAKLDLGPVGALMGYDFHVTSAGPKLIEVNTNAGGAFLNAILARAQHACCAEAHVPFENSRPQEFAPKIVEMFIAEWRRQRGSGQPASIAIVDDAPEEQYLYPEFRLARNLLDEHGFETVIADPKELLFDGSSLFFRGRPIDLLYNRLVDFALEEPRHASLLAAYVDGKVVVTPNPRAHALFADKRNLTLFSDADRLKQWGLAPNHLAVLRATVPATVIVLPTNADNLWANRRNLFFNPARGHGSKAAYRGDKVTRKVWAEISRGEYVAQSYAAPETRSVLVDEVRTDLKFDVRLYTFAGTVLLAAARLYQGQTTNMRTPGGGFAPVLEVGTPIVGSSHRMFTR